MSIEQTEPTSEQDSAFLNMVRANNERRATPEGEDNAQAQEQKPQEAQVQNVQQQEQHAEESPEEEKLDVLTDPLENKDYKPKRLTKDENIKNLRSSLQAERDRIKELEAELEQTRGAKAEIPEDVQAQIQEKDATIERLSKYEKLFGLYNTDGFKETYYDSVDALKERAADIAKDYEVDSTVIESVMGITNRKQLIETLSDYFDVHTAGEIRDIVLEAQSIVRAREEAEKNPDEVRAQLLSLVDKRKTEGVNKARDNMVGAVSAGWQRMLESYSDPQTGLDPLKEKPGDAEHMKNREAILESAQKDLSTIMGLFASNGLTTISDQVAAALAARFQLSAAASSMYRQLESLQAELNDYKKAAGTKTKYERPLSRGSNSGNASGPVETTPSGKDLAAHVFEKARQKLGT